MLYFPKSLPPYLLLKSLLPFQIRAHPLHPRVKLVSLRQIRLAEKIPGGISAHGVSGFEPEPFGLATEVTVNFTIPGTLIPSANPLDRNDLGGLFRFRLA